MNTHILTIIIPTYNSRTTISKLLTGLKNQIRRNIQICIVDDGSVDDTVKVINNMYLPMEFSLYCIKHSGVSVARNYGLDKADGKYVTFIDSDDVVTDDFINSFIKAKKDNTEILVFNSSRVLCNKQYKISSKNERYLLIGFCNNDYYVNTGLHGKFYLLKMLRKNKIQFNKKLIIGEDLIFNFNSILMADHILLSSKNIYHYLNTHTVNKFNLYNKKNEIIFQQELKKIIGFISPAQRTEIETYFKITGACFLVDRYYSYICDFKSIKNIIGISKELQKFLSQYDYINFISSNKYDLIIGKRNTIIRKWLSRRHYLLVLFISRFMDIVKKIKR